jgi:ribA/ribD-fused uncharacterized protein
MNDDKIILEFQGAFRWLSNFATCDITLKDRLYSSVENAYQSAKCDDDSWKRYCMTHKPSECKKMSHRITLVKNWDIIKTDIMHICLQQKFNQEPYKTLLRETGSAILQEGNKWHDTFWGVDLLTGKGENILGKMIMKIRENI